MAEPQQDGADTSKGETMLTRKDIESLLTRGGNVVGTDGEKIGPIGQLYADDYTGEPTWIAVQTGLFGASQSFIPVEGARIEGNDLVVPYTTDHVKDAPRVEAEGHLEPDEEDRLYSHYEKEGSRTYSEARADDQEDAVGGLRKYVSKEPIDTDGGDSSL
jgi:hypothetical protein